MKITFNDATSISVQSVTPKGDYLEIKTIEGPPEKLCEIFSNVDKTRKMIVEERGKQTVYEGYSFLGFGNIEHDHRCQFAVPTPSTMRLGTVSVSAPNGIKLFDGKTSYDGTLFESHASCNAGSAKMAASFPDAPVSTGGYVWLDSGQKLILDANL